MSKNKDRLGSAGSVTTATAKERRVSYGRRSTDLAPDDIEMLGKLEKVVDECIVEIEDAYKTIERNQDEFDRLKSESRVMLADTKQIISTFQTT